MQAYISNQPDLFNQPRKCPQCYGKGKIEEMGIETCGYCAGTGRDKTSDLWAEPCLNCNGTGRKTYCRWVTCKECWGSGIVPY